MADALDFHGLVAGLLDRLGLDGREETARRQDVYSLGTDDEPKINLLCVPEGCMTLLCFAGRLPKKAGRDAFLALLQANLYTFARPPITIAVDPSHETIVIWSRLELAHANVEETAALLERFTNVKSSVSRWLFEGAPAIATMRPRRGKSGPGSGLSK
jgi:hypothetical protein